jgi:hypothetical protein
VDNFPYDCHYTENYRSTLCQSCNLNVQKNIPYKISEDISEYKYVGTIITNISKVKDEIRRGINSGNYSKPLKIGHT